MKKGPALILFFIALLVVYQWATYRLPNDSVKNTKYLRQLTSIIEASGVIGCATVKRAVYVEYCFLKNKPSVANIRRLLEEHGWKTTNRKLRGADQLGVWCDGKNTIFLGFREDHWKITYDDADNNECEM